MDALRQDFRYGARMLLKNPQFTAVAVLVLALGIGANTATFSLTNALLLRPIEAESPQDLVALYSKDMEHPDSFRSISYPNYQDIRELNTSFSSVLAHDLTSVGLREGDTTQRVFAELVSSDYFDTFGVTPYRGRFFSAAEEVPDSDPPVTVVSYEFWRRHGADPDLVGKSINVGGCELTVVGIAPRYFTGRTALLSSAIYLPLGLRQVSPGFGAAPSASLSERSYHKLFLIGRLAPGVTLDEANARLEVLSRHMREAYPEINADQLLLAAPLDRLSISTDPSDGDNLGLVAALLLGMTGVVLLIACINLANMLLARGAARRREFAVRVAIGGGRVRILRQLLTEGLLLSLLGGAAGLVVAAWANSVLAASIRQLLSTNGLAMEIVMRAAPDLNVLLATAGFCMLGTLAFGLGPALQQSRPDVMATLREQMGDPSSGARRGVMAPRNLLVVGQLALSMVLLTTAGLFVRAAFKAAHVDPGFSLENGLVLEVDTSLVSYEEPRSRDLYRRLQVRLRALPGIEHVGIAATVPFGSVSSGRQVRRAEDLPGSGSRDNEIATVAARRNVIGDQYFEALGLPILRGRGFTRAETESDSGPRVAIVDELLAESLWPGQDPFGRAIGLGRTRAPDGADELEVVGLVPSVREDLFPAERRPHVYLPFGRNYQAGMNLHLRTAPMSDSARAQLMQSVQRTVREVDPRLPIVGFKTLANYIAESASLWLVRLGATVFGLFGGVALFLAVIGVYGVKAYAVARRTREIGIRKALGATTRDTLTLVLREGMALAALGLGLGLLLAAGVARLLASLLYEVGSLDPFAFVGSTGVLALAALAAIYVPARRAAAVAPATALRLE